MPTQLITARAQVPTCASECRSNSDSASLDGVLRRQGTGLRIEAQLNEAAVNALTQRAKLRTRWIQRVPIIIVHSIPLGHLGRLRQVVKQSPTVARIELMLQLPRARQLP